MSTAARPASDWARRSPASNANGWCFLSPTSPTPILWIFPRPGGASVGIAYTGRALSEGAARGALERFLDRHLPARWRDRPGPRYRYPIPVFGEQTLHGVRRALARRLLLVGGAAAPAAPLPPGGTRSGLPSWPAGNPTAGSGAGSSRRLHGSTDSQRPGVQKERARLESRALPVTGCASLLTGIDVVGDAGAVELDGVEADAVPALGAHHDLHTRLGRRRVFRRGAAGRRDHGVQVQEDPAEVERHGEVRAADLRRLRLRREGDDPLLRRLRRDRERLRHLRVLLLVEDDDRFLAQRIPGRRRAALEGALLDLRVAPHHGLRAAAEGAAVDEAAGERGRQRLAVVDRRPGVVAAVEGVLARNRGLRGGGIGLHVDDGVAVRPVGPRVDVE